MVVGYGKGLRPLEDTGVLVKVVGEGERCKLIA